jgi:ABC-type glycerol-3-phosphate transport system substrate-binding protein
VIYESGWAIGRHSRHADAAWKFIQYFTSAPVQRQLQKSGIGVCARKDVSKERAINEREREFLRIVPSGRNPWGAKVQGYDFVEDEGTKMMDSVLKSGKDPKAALKDFAATVDRELAKR